MLRDQLKLHGQTCDMYAAGEACTVCDRAAYGENPSVIHLPRQLQRRDLDNILTSRRVFSCDSRGHLVNRLGGST